MNNQKIQIKIQNITLKTVYYVCDRKKNVTRYFSHFNLERKWPDRNSPTLPGYCCYNF